MLNESTQRAFRQLYYCTAISELERYFLDASRLILYVSKKLGEKIITQMVDQAFRALRKDDTEILNFREQKKHSYGYIRLMIRKTNSVGVDVCECDARRMVYIEKSKKRTEKEKPSSRYSRV